MAYVNATVKYPSGKILNTQNGPRCNAVLTSDQGEEIKVWGDADDAALRGLRKGQQVQLEQSDRGGYRIVAPAPDTFGGGMATAPQALAAPQAAAVPQAQRWGPDHTKQLNDEAAQRAWLMRRCWDSTIRNFSDAEGKCLINADIAQKFATSIYIDLSKGL
jgi:hypothetical protein